LGGKKKLKKGGRKMKIKSRAKKHISWISKSGKKIEIANIRTKNNLADRNFDVDCDDIEVRIDGRLLWGFGGFEHDPKYGPVVKCHGTKIVCPDDVVEDVSLMITSHENRIESKINAGQQAETKNDDKDLCPLCGTYCCGDCTSA
jgi:hypothetical protein